MGQFNLNADPVPDCFGQSWNPQDVLCAGGADITYKDDKGSRVRPVCDFYQSCGARTSHSRMEQSRLMPATSLVRSPTPQQQPAPVVPQQLATPPSWMTPAQMQQWMNEQAKTIAAQMFQQMQQYPQPGRGTTTPYNPVSYPQGGVMGMYSDPRFQPMPVNYQMPAYLTVPEQRGQDDTLLGMLFRTVFRSVMKAGGHSFSHFWDTVPMGRQMGPGGGQ